jgi:hypothetical protein
MFVLEYSCTSYITMEASVLTLYKEGREIKRINERNDISLNCGTREITMEKHEK